MAQRHNTAFYDPETALPEGTNFDNKILPNFHQLYLYVKT